MARHVAFLRAINLGAHRKLPKAVVEEAVRAAGGTDVASHLNTGNVGFGIALRSRARIEAALEQTFLEAGGFEVPTVVLTPAEMHEVIATADAIEAELGSDVGHHVAFLKDEPTPEAVAALQAVVRPGERAVVAGRAVHLLLGPEYHRAHLNNTVVERHLGTATTRRVTVVREVARRWC